MRLGTARGAKGSLPHDIAPREARATRLAARDGRGVGRQHDWRRGSLERLTDAQLMENREYLTPLPEGAELLEPPVLHAPGRFRVLVQTATWGTLAIEALAAELWLAPLTRRGLLVARHGVVLLVCVTTYAFAPVAGFGWLLLVLGLATCGADERWLRALHVATYGIVLLYAGVPWAGMALAGLG